MLSSFERPPSICFSFECYVLGLNGFKFCSVLQVYDNNRHVQKTLYNYCFTIVLKGAASCFLHFLSKQQPVPKREHPNRILENQSTTIDKKGSKLYLVALLVGWPRWPVFYKFFSGPPPHLFTSCSLVRRPSFLQAFIQSCVMPKNI